MTPVIICCKILLSFVSENITSLISKMVALNGYSDWLLSTLDALLLLSNARIFFGVRTFEYK